MSFSVVIAQACDAIRIATAKELGSQPLPDGRGSVWSATSIRSDFSVITSGSRLWMP